MKPVERREVIRRVKISGRVSSNWTRYRPAALEIALEEAALQHGAKRINLEHKTDDLSHLSNVTVTENGGYADLTT